MRFLFILLCSVFCVSCVSIPDTEEELRANAYEVKSECSPINFEETYLVIARNTARCHAQDSDSMVLAAGVFIPLTTQDIVKGEVIEPSVRAKVTVEYVNPVEGGFLQAIDINATDECPAYVQVFVLNDTKKWQTSTESVFEWLEGDTVSCFELF